MRFVPYVYNRAGDRVSVTITPMTESDAEETDSFPKWQTSWKSEYLSSNRLDCYSVKSNGELIALGAYEIQANSLIVYIVYMESHPESNPTITQPNKRKYTGIGKVLIAFGIKLSIDNGFGGDVVLRAKTAELGRHYSKDFGAVLLPSFDDNAPRYLISDEAAKSLFCSYLE